MTPPQAGLFFYLQLMSQTARIYRSQAVVLSRRDQGEADRLLTVFTPALGKQEWIAKGIRKTTSRKAGHLELFTHATLLVAKARTWDIITEAATVESFRYLRTNLEAIAQASYLCELVSCFTEQDDDNQPLWDLLLLALRVLDEQAHQAHAQDVAATEHLVAQSSLLIRWFEVHLLGVSGFQPQLFYCLNCNETLTPVTNFLTLEGGGVYCPRCAQGMSDVEPIESDVLKILRHLQRTSWNELQQLSIRPFILLAVENVLRRYLLTVLERQLKSVQFLRKLQSTLPKLPAGAPPLLGETSPIA
jgi:DNA repair protein RecO (recombination protein O)